MGLACLLGGTLTSAHEMYAEEKTTQQKVTITVTETAPQKTNPFMTASALPFEAPDFSVIEEAHFLPAFQAGFAEQRRELAAIVENSAEPTFANTIESLERSGEILTRVRRVFYNLTSAHVTPEIQKIQAQLAPQLAAHNDDIYLNRDLFARVDALQQQQSQLELTEEQRQVLKETHLRFVRAGAKLEAAEQQRIRAINEQLSSLMTEFQDLLLALNTERAVIVETSAELAGLSEADIQAAAAAAEKQGHAGKYLLEITNTTRQPVLVELENRELRRRVWEASANRGLGRDNGIDTRPLVQKIARLRAEKAQLLGYESHAAYTLEPQMAKTPAAAEKMLTDLVPAVLERVKQEAADITALMKAEGIEGELQPWDWEFYAEKVRQERFGLDEAEVKQYLELNSVMQNGVFYTMQRLFGVTFRERTDIPVYHPDVRVFDVLNADGSEVGLFYADYFARPSKRGGAWMSSFVGQSGLMNQKPVIVNVMNIPKPVAGQPALIGFTHTTTMFHEMGHGVHGLFSNVEYPSISGTSVARDFVEYPSTFQEDWALDPAVLANYARHYETGEVLPERLRQQMIAARTFNQGYDTLEYLSAALLDLRWHALRPDEIPEDVEQFEAETLKALGIDVPAVPPRYRTAFFAHVWPGGYSASYYAYMWSEILAADSFRLMQQQGGLTAENGERYRQTILSRGGSRDPEQLYLDFAGRPPQVEGLLIRRGLLKEE